MKIYDIIFVIKRDDKVGVSLIASNRENRHGCERFGAGEYSLSLWSGWGEHKKVVPNGTEPLYSG